MFNFRIITCADGSEIIDSSLKTPYSSLTPLQMLEYVEMDRQLAISERMKKKRVKNAENKRKAGRNPFYKFACMCGLA